MSQQYNSIFRRYYKTVNISKFVAVLTALTRAPLLSRIIKIMKVSNQSCSTIVKQVLRRFHHFLPLPWVMSTVRNGQRLTHSGGRFVLRLLQKCVRLQQVYKFMVISGLQIAHTVGEAGLWLHWVWLFLFHFLWFRLRWLIVHCAAYRRIPIIYCTHQLVKNHKCVR